MQVALQVRLAHLRAERDKALATLNHLTGRLAEVELILTGFDQPAEAAAAEPVVNGLATGDAEPGT